MIKILRADFSRLFRNKLFWCFSAFLLVLSIWYCIASDDVISPHAVSNTFCPFEAMPILPFVTAVFTVFFIGVNFSSKIISNKLSSGASKVQIYLSNLIVSLIVSIFFSLSYIAAGIRLMANGKFPVGIYFAFVFIGAVLSVAFCAVSTFAVFILRKNASAVVVAGALIAVMFFTTSVLGNVLDEGKLTTKIETVNGVPYNNTDVIPYDAKITYSEIPNPEYCDGFKRTVYQFIFDILPTSRTALISNISVEADRDGVWFAPQWNDTVQVKSAAEVFSYVNVAYPLGLSVIITALGILLFRKKQLS